MKENTKLFTFIPPCAGRILGQKQSRDPLKFRLSPAQFVCLEVTGSVIHAPIDGQLVHRSEAFLQLQFTPASSATRLVLNMAWQLYGPPLPINCHVNHLVRFAQPGSADSNSISTPTVLTSKTITSGMPMLHINRGALKQYQQSLELYLSVQDVSIQGTEHHGPENEPTQLVSIHCEFSADTSILPDHSALFHCRL